MYWSRQQIKTAAKSTLSRTYWNTFLVCLLYNILVGVPGYITQPITLRIQLGGEEISPTLGIVAGFVSLGFAIAIVPVLMVGVIRYLLDSRMYDPQLSLLFDGFKKNCGNVIVTNLMLSVKVFLWSLLFIIPGIIKSYEYWAVPYILAENPRISQRRAFELSKAMTDGDKVNIWVLQLSFIGWELLGMLACGIGVLFVTPYILQTQSELYLCLRQKVIETGFASADELPGFLRTANSAM